MGEDDQKVQISSYKINNSRDTMFYMVTIVNNTILLFDLRVDLTYHKKKIVTVVTDTRFIVITL